MKIIHLTDPHLVPEGRDLWGTPSAERFSHCLEDVARWHGDADFCVISGDITNAGDPAAYAWVRERLEEFPLPTFLLIGNHDERDAFRTAFPNTPCDANGFVQYAHETDAGLFLFLDTKKQGPVSEGRYCAARRQWLSAQLAEADQRPVYIFMHHPPFDVGLAYVDRIKLEEPEAFAEVVLSSRSVRHIFFGHIHRATYVNWHGIPCTSLPSTNHQVPLTGGSVRSRYSREPPMVGIILLRDGQVTVHYDACLDRSEIAELVPPDGDT